MLYFHKTILCSCCILRAIFVRGRNDADPERGPQKRRNPKVVSLQFFVRRNHFRNPCTWACAPKCSRVLRNFLRAREKQIYTPGVFAPKSLFSPRKSCNSLAGGCSCLFLLYSCVSCQKLNS